MKNNLRVIILVPLLIIVAAFSAFRAVEKNNNVNLTAKEKLSYDIMVINARLLRDYYNGIDSTLVNNAGPGNSPEKFINIIFQHQNMADSQNTKRQRHKFRFIAYIKTATTTHLISQTPCATCFFLNDEPGHGGKPVPLGGADGSSDIFGNYIMTRDSLDSDKLSTATAVLLYPEPLKAANGSLYYVHYRIIYCPGRDPACKDFFKGLAPIKGDDQKLQEFIYKFNQSQKLNISSTGFLNPSPPA